MGFLQQDKLLVASRSGALGQKTIWTVQKSAAGGALVLALWRSWASAD